LARGAPPIEQHWHVPTPSPLCQARQRLGEAPLRRLFEPTAAPVATPATIGAWLHSSRLMAIDGVTLDVPDTPDNEAAFGRPASRTKQGGALPQLRFLGLDEWARTPSSPPNCARSASVSGNWPSPSSTTSSRTC
jgi:Insertion element 4 transposase N-terminal